MKSIIKSSRKASVADAVSEATTGISDAIGIVFFSDYGKLRETAAALSEKYPSIPIIGTAGTVYHNRVIDGERILIISAITGDAVCSAGVIGNLSTDPITDMYRLRESVSQVSPGRDDTVCVEFCTSNEEVLVSTINVILEPKKIPLAGGTVFGAPEGKPSLVSFGGEVYEDACAYMVIKNKTGRAYVLRENIYDRPDGALPHVATEVDLSRKAVLKLDGRPAADVYCEETGVSRNKLVDNVMQAPLGRIVDQDIYISSMNGVDSRGGITNYKRINKNDTLYILRLLDYRRINEDTREKIRGLIKKPSLILSVNCIYRYLLFQSAGYLDEFLRSMSEVAPFAGYIGGGEQYNRQHVNQTMVCAIFE